MLLERFKRAPPPSISLRFYGRIDYLSSSKLVSESGGLEFESRPRILILLRVIPTSLF
jgi:hypothetical protein